jgi:hypothetical protein
MAKRYKIGVDETGKSRAFARKNEPTLAVHHDPNVARAHDALHGDNSIARKGAPKQFVPVSLHNGMTASQVKGAGIGGQGHATAVVSGGQKLDTSAAAAPLAHAYGGNPSLKVGNAAPIVPGQRSRRGEVEAMAPGAAHAKGAARNGNHCTDFGRAMIATALCTK